MSGKNETPSFVFVSTAGFAVDLADCGPGLRQLLVHGLGPISNVCSMYELGSRGVVVRDHIVPAFCGLLYQMLGEEEAVRLAEGMPALIRESVKTMATQNQGMH